MEDFDRRRAMTLDDSGHTAIVSATLEAETAWALADGGRSRGRDCGGKLGIGANTGDRLGWMTIRGGIRELDSDPESGKRCDVGEKHRTDAAEARCSRAPGLNAET